MTISTTCSSTLLGEAYERVYHPCGMEILVSHKPMTSATAMLGVKYGSAHLPDGMPHAPLGVAHFLEHKVFEAPRGESFDRVFSELGAEVNAYTSYDRTVYYVNCTQRFGETLTELLSMVSALTVTPSSVKRERDIIAEEIRMNSDSPFERCYAELLTAMYASHRMREEICGSEASIKEITPKLLREIFGMYYRPDNMILTVCGNVTAEDILACVDAVFGGFDSAAYPPLPPDTLYDEPLLPAKPYTELCMQVPKPLMSMGVKMPAPALSTEALFRRDVCASLLCEMLFARSGELYDTLFEGGYMTPTYAYGYAMGKDYGYFAVSCECDKPKEVYRLICDYLDKVRTEGLPSADFERCRRVMYADYVTGFDSPEDMASALMSYAMDGIDLFDYLKVCSSLTLAEVESLFEECFVPEAYALSVVSPSDNSSEPHTTSKKGSVL